MGYKKKLDNISYGKPVRGTNPLKASQLSNAAKLRTDIEETKQKLNNLAIKWMGINSVYGFLTDLWIALGMSNQDSEQKGGNPSRYAAFILNDKSIVTVRASAHNADAANYMKDNNVNGENNLSIVLQKHNRKNRFKSHNEVMLKEYIYVDSRIASIPNPLSQVANSLIGYLTDGVYVDTTGVAIEKESPAKEKNMDNISACT
ncbi:MAG: hypothetical protein IKZ60_08685 [Bacteroidales bacterium]|nr:hypothetical protein [Bacteroidales bacterium]